MAHDQGEREGAWQRYRLGKSEQVKPAVHSLTNPNGVEDGRMYFMVRVFTNNAWTNIFFDLSPNGHLARVDDNGYLEYRVLHFARAAAEKLWEQDLAEFDENES